MGLGNSSHSVFIGIVDGKISRRHQAPIEGVTKTRQTATGKTIHEEFFDHVSGFITDISTKDHKDFGSFLVVSIVDGESKFSLEFSLDSGYATAFLKTLPNMDFSKRTTIIPKMSMEGDKKKVTVFINQGEKALKHYFSKDNPNGLPQMKSIIFKGKEQWDNTDQVKFFMNMLDKLRPKIQAAAQKLSVTPQAIPANATVKTDEINDPSAFEDDLPF